MPYNFTKRDRKEFYKHRLHKNSPYYKKFFAGEKQKTREQTHVPELTHKKGSFVNYNNEVAQVTKVTKKGVWIQRYSSEKGFLQKTTKKPTFIKESEYEKKAFPFYVKEMSGVAFSPFI